MKSENIEEIRIVKNNCDWIIDRSKELKALLFYNPEIIANNKTRALSSIETIRDSLLELEAYIKGK